MKADFHLIILLQQHVQMPSAIIFFSGTGSVSEALQGWDVVSLDNGCGHVNQSQLEAIGTAYVTDILIWDYKKYPVGHLISSGHHHLANSTHVYLNVSNLTWTMVHHMQKGVCMSRKN